ncbi:hypothetical protein PORY_001902 [Pneumocystis oryctolagi]|uniref:Uncharacterized protein n=1 Tax=Pneumocystis oryctolagi TaxID=42067 RepID=A0ACB7CHP0_9ASCO|nr:hypothetical protein PORY_001902 [Pneumocystis oryctolagi]
MNKSMRGLMIFISDLRNAKGWELEEQRVNEELANIRCKFKDHYLNSYQKKKYVCKLLYIYILGWKIDFGHMEAVHLISSDKYSEKQIGYLAMTLLLHENHDLIRLVINSIKRDLLDSNEYYNCLALHAIANIGSEEMGKILVSDVKQLLMSPISKNFVKKKAALTLLRLHRKHPGIIEPEWTESIISALDNSDLGVSLSITNLLISLVQNNNTLYEGCYLKAIHKLKRVSIVIDGEYTHDYIYYKVPAPWLQIKLLCLLQYYPPPDDEDTKKLVCKILHFIITSILHELPKNVQQNNIQNAILFEAINASIHIDIDEILANQTIQLLTKFISYKEINTRYLGLKTLTHLAKHMSTFESFKKHQDIIIQSLKDKDMSIQKKALELLYCICDSDNTKTIVEKLIHYSENANPLIKEEIAIKISILSEKYATEYEWYVNTMLKLINISKEYIGDDIWHRFVQIILDRKEIQEYAAKAVIKYLKKDSINENIIKVGGYILGEFGHLISNSSDTSPIEQFISLHSKFNICSFKTQALLMSTYIKFVNLFPEIKLDIQTVFEQNINNINSELQQRAYEYLALCCMPNNDLLRIICERMPPFSKKQSFLMSKIQNKEKGKNNKLENIKSEKILKTKSNTNTENFYKSTDTDKTIIENNLIGLEIPNTFNSLSSISSTFKTSGQFDTSDFISHIENISLSDDSLSENYKTNFNELLWNNEGLFYENEEIQINVFSEYHAYQGKMTLLYKNKSSLTYTSFTSSIKNSCKSNLLIVPIAEPPCTLNAYGQIQQILELELLDIFLEPPTISISYISTSLKSLTLTLPIVLSKFSEGVELDSNNFFQRWKQIGKSLECQKIFSTKNKEKKISFDNNVKILKGFGWEILKEIDTNDQNIVGASVLYTSQKGKFGCLLRLEPNYETKMYRITIRSTKEGIANHLESLIEKKLTENNT